MMEKNTRTLWENSPVMFVADKTANEIRSVISSQKYGPGGKWINDMTYRSIAGYKIKDGMPLKLKTKDEVIPISETDAQVLLKEKLIKPVNV